MACAFEKESDFPTRWVWERAFRAVITAHTKACGHLSSNHPKDPEGCILSPLNRLCQEEVVPAPDRKPAGQPVKAMSVKEFDLTL